MVKKQQAAVPHSKWLQRHTASLKGKTVVITGSTGGLGKELCRYLARCEASLILVDRNSCRSNEWRMTLEREFANIHVTCVTADLGNMRSVNAATETLQQLPIDVFIHNAGAYSIPKKRCDTGWDRVFQINFVSPYYMIRELLPQLRERNGHVVVVGSIAHTYTKIDPDSIDLGDQTKASLLYGNAKRYLMFSMYELFREESRVTYSVTHPGISFTGITDHYPKWLFMLIKHPMKVIFMKPKTACLSIVKGVFDVCGECEWIGPAVFDVWGMPKKKRLRTCDETEIREIGRRADLVYYRLKSNGDV